MGHIFLGHGGLDPQGYSYKDGMGTVAVPPGTSLQFYSDTGQILITNKNLLLNWDALDRPWEPLTSANVTYNLGLSPFKDLDEAVVNAEALIDGNGWGHTIHIPGFIGDLGEDELLCTGEVGQCPTDPREQRDHSCAGILARFTGELFWIACTSVMIPTTERGRERAGMTEQDALEMEAVIAAALGTGPKDAVLGADPDNLLAATLRMLEYPDDELDLETYFYLILTDEQLIEVQRNDQVANWLSAHPKTW